MTRPQHGVLPRWGLCLADDTRPPNQSSRRLKEKWAKLTNEDLAGIAGRCGQLVTVLQDRNGYEKDRAETELTKFIDGMTS